MHRDSLCTRDQAYMRLRRWLRNPLRSGYCATCHWPPGTSWHRKLRKESRAQTRMKAVDIIDVTPEEVPRVMRGHGVRTLIHGHTHRPAEHPAGHRRPARPAHRARRLGPPGLGPGDRRQRPSPSALPALTHPRPAMRAFQRSIMRFAFFPLSILTSRATFQQDRAPHPHQGMIVIISKGNLIKFVAAPSACSPSASACSTACSSITKPAS